MNNLTPKQLKLAVTKSIANDYSLADKIRKALGFEPRWSRMSVIQLAMLQQAWEKLMSEREDK